MLARFNNAGSLALCLSVIAVGHLSDCGTSEAGLRTDQPHALAHARPSSIYTGTVSSYNLVAERMVVHTANDSLLHEQNYINAQADGR